MKYDDLSIRMKENYEHRTRYYVPRRTYTILRLDGKKFHQYTKKLKKPFDKGLFEDIDSAIIEILPQIQGAVFAYTQSDEISILLSDFASPTTCAWFDGNLQKMASVSASLITAAFNKFRYIRESRRVFDLAFGFISDGTQKVYERYDHNVRTVFDYTASANFDARIFTIPDRIEVMNYVIWRGNDCSRNSISMIAQSMFSHKELQGKSTLDMIAMIRGTGTPLENYSMGERYGRLILKEQSYVPTFYHGTLYQDNAATYNTLRSKWVSKSAWKFTDGKEKLLVMIPKYE